MALTIVVLGLLLALTALAGAFYATDKYIRIGLIVAAGLIVVFALVFSSIRFVPADRVGIVTKNALGPKLTDGRIIATEGEMGVQAEVLPPGWHTGYWPVLFDVRTVPLTEVETGQVGLVESRDGVPLDQNQLFAPEVSPEEFKQMVEDASYFLTEAGGRKGPQSNVLTPGKYRINTELFKIETVDATEVPNASVAVLKANFGDDPTVETMVVEDEPPVLLAGPNERGVRREVRPPGKYPLNPDAYKVEIVSNKVRILYFTAGRATDEPDEQREITVRTSDGFTFPVDVRVQYRIDPEKAPIVIAKLGDDRESLVDPLNSAVRAIFRNNAEDMKALDYVQQRSQQESQSLTMLQEEMKKLGVTVVAVRIGDVGTDDPDLAPLLKTQTDREIAVQEQITFQEQQKAAEQKKELTRTEQEAEEEKRLATASYEVQIAEQDKQRRLIQAEAEAEALRVEAEGRAEAFRLVAEQIGPSNAALVELLQIIGEDGIEITPRVMVSGDRGMRGGEGLDGGSPESVALIGTMLDTMLDRQPVVPKGTGQRSAAAESP